MLMRVRDNHLGHPSAQRSIKRTQSEGAFSAVAYVRAYYERLTEGII